MIGILFTLEGMARVLCIFATAANRVLEGRDELQFKRARLSRANFLVRSF